MRAVTRVAPERSASARSSTGTGRTRAIVSVATTRATCCGDAGPDPSPPATPGTNGRPDTRSHPTFGRDALGVMRCTIADDHGIPGAIGWGAGLTGTSSETAPRAIGRPTAAGNSTSRTPPTPPATGRPTAASHPRTDAGSPPARTPLTTGRPSTGSHSLPDPRNPPTNPPNRDHPTAGARPTVGPFATDRAIRLIADEAGPRTGSSTAALARSATVPTDEARASAINRRRTRAGAIAPGSRVAPADPNDPDRAFSGTRAAGSNVGAP